MAYVVKRGVIMARQNRTVIREGGGFPGRPFEFEAAAALTGFPLMHGVTRRFGGVSKKPFDSFNLGLHVGDDIEAVWENRRRLAKHLRVRSSAASDVYKRQVPNRYTVRKFRK